MSPSILISFYLSFLFFFNDPATTEMYTLSLHDALPIFENSIVLDGTVVDCRERIVDSIIGKNSRIISSLTSPSGRSEEHTSELQSHSDLVCRLLLEKKKKKKNQQYNMDEIYDQTHVL